MKKGNIQIVIICLVLVIIYVSQAQSAEWVLYAEPASGTMYYDKSSIKKINNNITVLTKKYFNKNEKTEYFSDMPALRQEIDANALCYDIDLLEIDCKEKRQKLISTNFYNEENEIIFSYDFDSPKWWSVGANSIGEIMLNRICSVDSKVHGIKNESEQAFQGITAQEWFNKAELLWDGKKYSDPSKVIEYLNNATNLKPDFAEAYRNRGKAYHDLGQYQRAIEDYNTAIRFDQNDANAYSNRGIDYVELKQYQRAIDDFNNAIKIKPYTTKNYNLRGLAYLIYRDEKHGCDDIQKACELGDCKVLEEVKVTGTCNIMKIEKLTFEGGDGSSIEKAVIIKNAKGEMEGVEAERKWIKERHPTWKKGNQMLLNNKGKYYDAIECITTKGEQMTVYFDITEFFGKL